MHMMQSDLHFIISEDGEIIRKKVLLVKEEKLISHTKLKKCYNT